MSAENIVEKIKRKINRKQELDQAVIPFNRILEMEAIEEPFLLQGIIVEGAVNALTSDSGKGKSLLMLKMIEAIATGEKFLGEFETKKSKTLILDLEMSKNSIIMRAKSVIGHEMDGLDIYCCQGFNIFDDNDFDWLKNIIKTNEYKLLVLDTYSMGVPSKNENDNAEANNANRKFLEIINECNITILFLHHHRKLQKGEIMSQSTSRGATDIINKTASHILIDARDITINDGEEGLRGIRITGEQMKRREAVGFERFAVKVWYNPFEKKSYFEFDGYEEKAASAFEKTKSLILEKMDIEEEWTMEDINENIGKSSNIYSVLKELIEKDKSLISRFPQPGEVFLGDHKLRSNSKIYKRIK